MTMIQKVQMSRRLSLVAILLHLLMTRIYSYECKGSNTPPLVLEGKRFYDSSNGQYVPIKGIAYYPRPNDGRLSEGNSVDFYTDEFSSRWQIDIENMKDLGVNAVRIYAVDPSANHDSFMCALSQAGIYVMVGLLADCEECGIGAWVGKDAEPPLCYSSTVKERGKFVIRSFSKYPNLMAFSAGNEVTIYADDGKGGPREINIPCQKKFLRDMREYVSVCTGSYQGAVLPRAIPIGTVNWDNRQTLEQHVYYNCRTDPRDLYENSEWFALNSYRHCDGSAATPDDLVGWMNLLEYFRAANFPGPILLGEYGCRERGFPTMDGFEAQRTWLQTEALYSPQYSEVFAGGFVFEYSSEKRVVDINLEFMADLRELDEPESEWPYQKFAKLNYGLGYFSPSTCEHNAGDNDCRYTKYPEWDGLVAALATEEGQMVPSQSDGTIPECPSRFPSLSEFDWPTDSEVDLDLEYCLKLEQQSLVSNAPSYVSSDSPTDSPIATTDDEVPSLLPSTPHPTSSLSTLMPSSPSEDGQTEIMSLQPTLYPTTVEDSGDSSALCSSHTKCFEAGLIGKCCPTLDGVNLGCCDRVPLFPWEVDPTEAKPNSLQSSGADTFTTPVMVSTLVVGTLLVFCSSST